MQYAAFARDGNECLWISFAGQHRLAIIGQDTQTSLPMMADRWYCIPRCMQVNNLPFVIYAPFAVTRANISCNWVAVLWAQYVAFAGDANEHIWISFAGQHLLAIIAFLVEL